MHGVDFPLLFSVSFLSHFLRVILSQILQLNGLIFKDAYVSGLKNRDCRSERFKVEVYERVGLKKESHNYAHEATQLLAKINPAVGRRLHNVQQGLLESITSSRKPREM